MFYRHLLGWVGYCLVGLLYAHLYYFVHLRRNPETKDMLLGVVVLCWPAYLAMDGVLGAMVGLGRLIKWMGTKS